MIGIPRLKRALFLSFIVLMVSLFLTGFTGCEDRVERIKERREAYCDKTADSLAKRIAIKAIRTRLPGYPEEGICTDIGGVKLENAVRLKEAIIAEETIEE